jgi:mono/diheme cytochrome c family protein
MTRHLMGGLFLMAVAIPALAQEPQLQRGKYLVEEVARCQECHTPKTASGEFDATKAFKGTKLNIAAIEPMTGWHASSPDLTSTSPLWQRWGMDGMVTFLETARNPRGGKAGPPMPAYTMKTEDAQAIAAYLKSLP